MVSAWCKISKWMECGEFSLTKTKPTRNELERAKTEISWWEKFKVQTVNTRGGVSKNKHNTSCDQVSPTSLMTSSDYIPLAMSGRFNKSQFFYHSIPILCHILTKIT
jgi:hypothetical protein